MSKFSRRDVVKGGLTVASLSALPVGIPGLAWGATENEKIIAAAKGAGGGDLKGMIWSNYYVAMTPSMERFKQATGIGVGSIQDISIFVIPQRAMAEALSRSPEFDFFHVDSNMIPSLASAGLLEPLDGYMKKADFSIDAVGTYGNFMRYKGNTYGVPTDGNVHVQFTRKDLMENPDEQKRFEDKHGKKLAYPVTWEDDQQLMEFFHRPDQELWGSANLRNRANGVTWWYMYFYSAGGFPFDDDMNPTLDTPAGRYAVETYLNIKKVSHPEAPGWGTPQMIPRITTGKAFACQYWDGIIALNENPKKSKTAGKWHYSLAPGSKFSGKLIHRAISSPLGANPRQQVFQEQGEGGLYGDVVGFAQELRGNRRRPGQHVPRSVAHRAHDLGRGQDGLHAGRHRRDRDQPQGRLAADLPDRLPGVPGPARQEPVRGVCRTEEGRPRAEGHRGSVGEDRQAHRQAPAQEGARELQGRLPQGRRSDLIRVGSRSRWRRAAARLQSL